MPGKTSRKQPHILPRRQLADRSRSGVAVLIVLLMVAAAMAMGYTAVRLQGMHTGIQYNNQLAAAAEQALMSGLALAVRYLHSPDWRGVDSSYSALLDDRSYFVAQYTTGDPALDENDPDWQEYPYRVTITVTAYVRDPSDWGKVVSRQGQAVMRLVPRAVSNPPDGWQDITDNTVCQWQRGTFRIQSPVRFDGPVRIRSTLELNTSIDWSYDVRWDFLDELKDMFHSGTYADKRPLGPPVRLNVNNQTGDTLDLLWNAAGLSTENTSDATDCFWQAPTNWTSYRLYPGGKLYSAQLLNAKELLNYSLKPDPQTNPLGIAICSNDLKIKDNVNLTGTLLVLKDSTAKVEIEGTNIKLSPANLPPYEQSVRSEEYRIRLPTLICDENIIVKAGSQSDIEGLVMSEKEFRVDPAPQDSTKLTILGHLAATIIKVEARNEWKQSKDWWKKTWEQFKAQEATGEHYFPVWLLAHTALDYRPQIAVYADNCPYNYHWPDFTQPLFLPHSADASEKDSYRPGLRWEWIRCSTQ